jgi:hypothetical protein
MSPTFTAFDPGEVQPSRPPPALSFSDPTEQSLIRESGRQTMVKLDLLVEFDAPVTHSISPFFRPGETTFSCHFTTDMALT